MSTGQRQELRRVHVCGNKVTAFTLTPTPFIMYATFCVICHLGVMTVTVSRHVTHSSHVANGLVVVDRLSRQAALHRNRRHGDLRDAPGHSYFTGKWFCLGEVSSLIGHR